MMTVVVLLLLLFVCVRSDVVVVEGWGCGSNILYLKSTALTSPSSPRLSSPTSQDLPQMIREDVSIKLPTRLCSTHQAKHRKGGVSLTFTYPLALLGVYKVKIKSTNDSIAIGVHQ